jgi:transaldolase
MQKSFRLFLDCAEIEQIRDAVSTGLVEGIATNPNKIAESGKTYSTVLDEIRSCFEGPIAFQALGRSEEELKNHARQIHKMDPMLAVKVTANKLGLSVIKTLVAEGIRTNATLIFNPAQALLAGLAGSPFISPFIGRARMVGYDGIEAVRKMRQMFDALSIRETTIVGASIKDVDQVIEVIIAGAHSVAVPFSVFEAMMDHPLTERGLHQFIAEYESVNRQ